MILHYLARYVIIDRYKYAIPLGLGSLAKYCFTDFSFTWMIPFVMFIFLLKFERGLTGKQSFITGYIFGLGYFTSSLYWVRLSFECVGMPKTGIAANIVLILYLSLYFGAALYVTTKLFRKANTVKYIFFACSWTLCEYFRGIIFTGFPWNLIGYATYSAPFFKQTASIIGIYGVSLIYMLVICLCFLRKTRKYSLIIVGTATLYGGYAEIYQKNEYVKNDINIHIIQPCVKQKNKLNPFMFTNNLNCHLAISDLDKSDQTPESKKIVIWPEAAINTILTDEITACISSHISSPNTYLFFGTDRKDNNGKIYNSSVLVNKSGEILATYDKKHLLPFGEFIPEFLLKLGLKKVTSGMVNFTKGNNERVISANGIPNFGVIICYEAAFPGEIVDNKRPEWIINITNDAWFEGSDEVHQHLITTAFRAIEEGIPIIRSANTGISCVINRFGKIAKILPENTYGLIKTKIPQSSAETVYSKFGNSIFLIGVSILILGCFIRRAKTGQKNRLYFSKNNW